MDDKITRTEFVSEMRQFRSDNKADNENVCDKIDKAVDKLTDVIILARRCDQGLIEVKSRLDKVNGRLDTHTDQIADIKATAETAKVLAETNDTAARQTTASLNRLIGAGTAVQEMSGRAKAGLLTAGGVSVLAVLHSCFEMMKSVGPEILKFLHK